MATNNPEDNKAYCKAYYQRIKQDPAKRKAFLEKRAQRQQAARTGQAPESMQLHIYLIEAEGLGHIKVGLAENPSFRLKQLQTGSPVKLHLRASYPCSVRDAHDYERALHKQLKEYRVLGEWFRADSPMLQVMLKDGAKREPDAVSEFLDMLDSM